MGKYNDDDMFMLLTEIFAKQSHCRRLQVAALIVKDGRILSVGYNGTPKGLTNCDEIFSETDLTDKSFSDEHHRWSDINELHAEQNAISWAAKQGISIIGATMYVKYSPCRHCTKMIIASGIKRLVYQLPYDREIDGLTMMTKAGIEINKINSDGYLDFKNIIKEQIF